MSNPKVSVIISCYNYGHFLRDAVDSVMNQSYQDFEVIVCDDASPDNTPQVMARILKEYNDPRILYVRHGRNIGQSYNRNVGIRKARGEYIAFLDADDTFTRCKTQKQVEILDNNPDFGLVYCLGNHYNEDMSELISMPRRDYYPHGWVTEELFKGSFIQGMSVMVRKWLLAAVGGFPNKDETYGVGVDWRMLLEISTIAKFHSLADHCYNYRIHGTQMSTNIERRINSDYLIRKMFIQNHPGLISEKGLRNAELHAHLQAGYYYRKNGRKREALREYIQYIRKNPKCSIGYKAGLKTIISHAEVGGH